MRNIKLTLEYDGSGFYGFQHQPGKATIQQALEKAFAQLFREKIKIASASGRTDAGVHAEAQIVNFHTDSELPLYRIQRGLNHFLPESISVLQAEEVSPKFHARYSAKSKTYAYQIWNSSAKPALLRGKVFHEPQPLDLTAMKKAAKVFVGKHDFRAMTSGDQILKAKKSPEKFSFVRTVKKCAVTKKGALITVLVEADGFLFHMVRNMAGVLVAAGRGKLAPGAVAKILKSGDRKQAPETLPACGLTLKIVRY